MSWSPVPGPYKGSIASLATLGPSQDRPWFCSIAVGADVRGLFHGCGRESLRPNLSWFHPFLVKQAAAVSPANGEIGRCRPMPYKCC